MSNRVYRFTLRSLLIIAVAFPLAGIASFEALFAPSAKLWPRWQAHDPAATATIDHVPWQNLLDFYLRTDGDDVNRFDYGRVSANDRRVLDRYIADLAARPIDSYNRDEQRAFWINLYNALTVRVVLEHYPVESILDIDISPGFFSDGPWAKPLVTVAGVALTLNDIEHRILRPIWRDPRLHYALNCASVGCPNLSRKAVTVSNAEAILETAARDYVNAPRGVRLENGRLTVSSIYVWFMEDFGRDDRAVIAHLARYAEPALAARLASVSTIADHDYDWSLNDARNAN